MFRHFGFAAALVALSCCAVGCDEQNYDDVNEDPTVAPVIDEPVIEDPVITDPTIEDPALEPGEGYDVQNDETQTIQPNARLDEDAIGEGAAGTTPSEEASNVYEGTPVDPDSPNAFEDEPAPATGTAGEDPEVVEEVPAQDDSL